MTIILNGTSGITFPDGVTQTDGLVTPVPVADGGTGLTSVGTSGNVLTSNGTAWVSQAISAGGDYVQQVYNSPATWTKPAGLKAVKVTVVGAGGNGGVGTPFPGYPGSSYAGGNGGGGGAAIEYLDAPAIPGPVTVTVGSAPSKTSSFGGFLSATGGTNGANASPSAPAPQPTGVYPGGAGSGGQINASGEYGLLNANDTGGRSGASGLGFGQGKSTVSIGAIIDGLGAPGIVGLNYGGGGIGGTASAPTRPGGAGAPGIVIVEEFY